ncbi:MAG: hypothetical protein HGA96_02045 [Desulfobulbaceae bacterium]|nr:hypothetical protein [Desulfobulbaceae bacterium]
MGKNKEKAERERELEPQKRKEVCCEKYLKKGKRCKSCPETDPDRPAK